jgi:quinol monooxygenase YgiN
MTVVIITHLTVKPDKVEEARLVWKDMVADVTANEPGTTLYRFYTDDDRPNVFWAYEQFADAEAKAIHLARHQHRVPYILTLLDNAVMNNLSDMDLS